MRSNLATKLDKRIVRPNVAVEECRDMPGAWTIEAIDNQADGSIYQAIFVGPAAKARATEYAKFKYGA